LTDNRCEGVKLSVSVLLILSLCVLFAHLLIPSYTKFGVSAKVSQMGFSQNFLLLLWKLVFYVASMS